MIFFIIYINIMVLISTSQYPITNVSYSQVINTDDEYYYKYIYNTLDSDYTTYYLTFTEKTNCDILVLVVEALEVLDQVQVVVLVH